MKLITDRRACRVWYLVYIPVCLVRTITSIVIDLQTTNNLPWTLISQRLKETTQPTNSSDQLNRGRRCRTRHNNTRRTTDDDHDRDLSLRGYKSGHRRKFAFQNTFVIETCVPSLGFVTGTPRIAGTSSGRRFSR